MSCVGRCGIYNDRPDFCKVYFTPSGCTFTFEGDVRKGECQPDVCLENNCCNYPREGGEPEGVSMDSLIGGEPCKHLVWVEIEDNNKEASGEDLAESITNELYETLMPSIRGEDVL